MVRFVFVLAVAAAIGVACGETLPAREDPDAPGRRDAGDEADAGNGVLDAQTRQDVSVGDALEADAAPSGPGWQCDAPVPSSDFVVPAQCSTARGMAGCDGSIYPPDAGSTCDVDAEAAQTTFCTTCRQINTIYRFETVTCNCQP